MVDDAKLPVPGTERAAYALIPRDGGNIHQPLRNPGAQSNEWFDHVAVRGPQPCPWNADVVALGRIESWNRRTGRSFRPNMLDRAGPGPVDPWSGRRGELVFAWPRARPHAVTLPALIRPAVAHAEARSPLTFNVSFSGECLDLRAAPASAAPAGACATSGATVTLAEQPGAAGSAAASFVRNADGVWAYIRTAAADRGWVPAEHLAWA